MQQYFVSGKHTIGDEVMLSKAQQHHIKTVLRMKEGASIRLADEDAQIFLAEVRIQGSNLSAVLTKRLPSFIPRVHITIGAALIKGERWDYMCQKCSELGVSTIQPLMTSRCVVKIKETDIAKKTERWNKITMEACEQCQRADLVRVKPPCDLSSILTHQAELKLFAYERADMQNERLLDVVNRFPDVKDILCIVGPEGGFSDVEANQLIENGFHTVSLGPRILRAETAAISVVNLLSLLYNS